MILRSAKVTKVTSISSNSHFSSQATFTRRNSLHDINIDKQKIGYFTATATNRLDFQHPEEITFSLLRREKGHGESSSTCQSDDEDVSGGGFLSDSESSDSDSDSGPEGPSGFPAHTGKRILAKDRSASPKRFPKVYSPCLQCARSKSGQESDIVPIFFPVFGGARSRQELERGKERRQHRQILRQHLQINQ